MDNSLPTQPVVPTTPSTSTPPVTSTVPTSPAPHPVQPPAATPPSSGLAAAQMGSAATPSPTPTPSAPVSSQPATSPSLTPPVPPKKSSKLLMILIPLLLLLIAGGAGAYYYMQNYGNPFAPAAEVTPTPAASDLPAEPVACTMEAKLCPDGSSVGRSGPNCEFAECPAPTETVPAATTSGTVKTQMGFSLSLPGTFKVISETPEEVKIGADENGTTVEYLTVTKALTVGVAKLQKCTESTTVYPCLSNGLAWGQPADVQNLTVGGVEAQSFYASYGTDSDFHFINITGANPMQFKMNISGGGLEEQFQQILQSITFG